VHSTAAANLGWLELPTTCPPAAVCLRRSGGQWQGTAHGRPGECRRPPVARPQDVHVDLPEMRHEVPCTENQPPVDSPKSKNGQEIRKP
jgi:hypothetical protein